MSSYETVHSLDNILKELDDICHDIDDLTDVELNNNNNDSQIPDIEYYQKIIKNPSIHLSSVGLASINNSISLNKNSLGNKSEPISLRSKQAEDIYVNEEEKDVYDRYNLSNFQQGKPFQVNNKNAAALTNFVDTNNNANNSYQEEEKKSKTNFLKPITDMIFNSSTNPFKKHRLPSADSKDLNTVIGSVRESFFFKKLNSLPVATKTKTNDDYLTNNNINNNNYSQNNNNDEEFVNDFNQNSLQAVPIETYEQEKILKEEEEEQYEEEDEEAGEYSTEKLNRFDVSKVRASPELKRNSKLFSSPSLQENDQADNFGEFNGYEDYDESNENMVQSSRKTPLFDEDADYLNPHEIAKIECFYNSMGCYVYVSKCIAELYQIKREDEFDAIDNDPVNEYKIYMESLNNKQSMNNFSKSKVNYTYINSGVPVIVFNYAANPVRDKDLRILLVERSTGFCMWEFKFDWLTQLDYSNRMIALRLTLHNNMTMPIMSENAEGGSAANLNNQNSATYSTVPPTSMNYHNEYFEKFFNSKNRHAHKEHLLKFVIKRDCNEFSLVLSRIMSDKRNGGMFIIKKETYAIFTDEESCFPPPLTSSRTASSVIICHFDSLVNDSYKKGENTDSSQTSLSDPTNYNENVYESGLKPSIKSNLSQKSKFMNEFNRLESLDLGKPIEFETDSNTPSAEEERYASNSNETDNKTKTDLVQVKYRKLRKSDISSPLSFSHVSHLDKPVAIGKRYKFNYS